ncbi:uncharacterized protein LOC128265519 [Drosophila gunungcola]|uniref:uncharacterized protein LOC128265519 n=1 Tax=Drosophila gunungcola TaxID=103775 RepID=UPI0022E464DF|nr:uncharacterized protein LOC128265519 [Drosophila gunungcola]
MSQKTEVSQLVKNQCRLLLLLEKNRLKESRHPISCLPGPVHVHFPVLRKSRTLSIGNISQATLEEVFQNCRRLETLVLHDKMAPGTVYDIRNIGLCHQLKVLLLPLEIGTPLAICHLVNLTHLTLQRQKLWPGMDWLPTVQAIIQAKRFHIQALSFDGSWLVAPLHLSQLQLAQCTALTELRLSNCKLGKVGGPPLPFCCKTISFRRCSLIKLYSYINSQPMLRELELFDCKVVWEAPVMGRILSLRQRQPVLEPLLLTFSQSTQLRSEYTKWTKEQLAAFSQWLLVRELEPQEADTWNQPVGTVSMRFSASINYLPDLKLPEESIPNAAVVVQQLNAL